MRITFLGGAQMVTGANYLLEVGDFKFLVDCGLFQGSRYSEEYNYRPLAYDPSLVQATLITHSHIDHIGRLPKLYKDGFRGTIYAVEPTVDICEVALPDAMDKMLEEARTMGHESLYGKDDFRGVMSLFRGIKYSTPIVLNESVTAVFHEASHILGSAIIEVLVKEDGSTKRIVFTGDLGNPPTTLLNPIDYVPSADFVVTESAYGNRLHENREERQTILKEVIIETIERQGVLMIPSFAVERTQELLLELDELLKRKKIPAIPIFVDSPLAIEMTKVYGRHSDYFNPTAAHILENHGGLFNFSWLKFTPSVGESKKINDIPSPKIIIAGSGMSTGGRILHHEMRYLPGKDNTILFIGYQVAGSLGRKILDGEKNVKVLGQDTPVNCVVRSIPAYSAHADQNGLVKFVKNASEGDRLKKVFIVQGEPEAAQALAERINKELNITAIVPEMGSSQKL